MRSECWPNIFECIFGRIVNKYIVNKDVMVTFRLTEENLLKIEL